MAAAAKAAGLNASEERNVLDNLVIRALDMGVWRLGQPAKGSRDEIAPEDADAELEKLRAGVLDQGTDLLVMDPFAALTAAPDENNNAVIASLLMRLARLATATDCGIMMAHHLTKMTRETAAAMRKEVVGVRGAGAFVFNVRVTLSLTHLTATEIKEYGLLPPVGEAMRQVDRPKANNLPPMDPAFFQVVSVPVQTKTGATQNVRAMAWVPAPVRVVDAVQKPQLGQVLAIIREGFEFDPVKHPGVRVGYTDHQRGESRNVIPAISAAAGLSTGDAKILLNRFKAEGLVCTVDEVVAEFNAAQGKPRSKPHKRLDLTPEGAARAAQGGPAAPAAPDPATPDPAGPTPPEPARERREEKILGGSTPPKPAQEEKTLRDVFSDALTKVLTARNSKTDR